MISVAVAPDWLAFVQETDDMLGASASLDQTDQDRLQQASISGSTSTDVPWTPSDMSTFTSVSVSTHMSSPIAAQLSQPQEC